MSRTTSAKATFDYTDIDEPATKRLKSLVEKIRRHSRSSTKIVRDTGLALLDAKRDLKHGKFNAWVLSECGISLRTAERYMRAVEVLEDKSDAVSDLQPSTIYRLSAKNMPASIVAQVLAHLTDNGALSDNEANDLINKLHSDETARSAVPPRQMRLSRLISAWRKASIDDRNALLDSERSTFANGVWQRMTPEEQRKFVRDRKQELDLLLASTPNHPLGVADLQAEGENVVSLFDPAQSHSVDAHVA